MVLCLTRSYHFVRGTQHRTSSLGLVTSHSYNTDRVSTLRKLTVKNLLWGYFILFCYFLLCNFMVMIL